MYAVDTHLMLAGNSVDSIELNLNEDLASISEWLTANKLTLNKSKTEFMIIGSRQRLKTLPHSPSLKIDGAPISQVPSTKSLGVYIDENLTWNVHIENLSNMASDRMRKKIKDYADIFGHIMRKHALIMRKLHRIMRKLKQVIKLIIRPVQCIYMLTVNP